MTAKDLKQARAALRLTQQQLADRLKMTRLAVTRYECGTRRIPGFVEVILTHLIHSPHIGLLGTVAAGNPIEPIPQMEVVEVPRAMASRGDTFALRVKGDSMRNEGILPGDLVIVRKQMTARNGQTIIALVNNEATIKTYYRKGGTIELHPANEAMNPMVIKPTDTFRIEGLVIGVIRYCK